MTSKQQLRDELRARRDELAPAEVRERSAAIQQRLLALPEITGSSVIHIYVDVRNEVRTRALIEEFWKQEKTVLVPILAGHALESFHLTDWSQIVVDEYGRCSPTGYGHYDGPIDVAIVPGLGYTERGDRLGSGYGHYDRFLAAHAAILAIAPAYEFQIVPQIPHESHDQRMDLIVIPDRVIRPS